MENKYVKLPGIFLDITILDGMIKNLTDCEIGNVIRCVRESMRGNTTFEFTPAEKIYYELLNSAAIKKADKWLNQTFNFRNNNPKKKDQ